MEGLTRTLRPELHRADATTAEDRPLQRLEVPGIEPSPKSLVNRFKLRRSIRSTSPHRHCTTTGGAEFFTPLGAGRTGRGVSAMVDFGGERRPIPERYDAPGAG
jgi:hypothetical protein